MSFKTIITNLGAAKIAAAIQGGGTVNLSHMALGDGGGHLVEPNADQTSLVREVYRAELNLLARDQKNPNYVIAEMVVPSTVGGWSVREVALYDNSGSMIAVGSFPETYKPELSEGSARDLIVRFIMEVSTNASVALQIDPTVVLATRQWVSDNFALAFVLPGGTTGQVLRKRSNDDGDFEWYDPASGLNLLVDIVEENQDLAESQTVVNLSVATMESTAVYIDGVRLRGDGTEYTIDSTTKITLAEPATSGQKITFVQNEPAGAAEFLRTGNNLSELAEPDKAAAARGHLGVGTVAQTLNAVLQMMYPVGEIWMTNRQGNPADLLGFGVWERHAKGRMPVSLNPDDATFSVLGATGGSKTHTLTVNELPTHAHGIAKVDVTTSTSGGHVHVVNPGTITTGTGGAHVHQITIDDDPGSSTNSLCGTDGSPLGGGSVKYTIASSGAHAHTFTINAFNTGSSGSHAHVFTIPARSTETIGSGQPHNNLPPYFVVNIWRRVA
ncbi:MAG TPA: phage tail protein [Chthoniobacteraceae bacterium]|nr:phage tail protein [Chthoniobacteraceae bacterium]